jgi:hypothetical protein
MDLREGKCGAGKNRAPVFAEVFVRAAARVRLRSQLSSVYGRARFTRANVRTVGVCPVAMRAQPKGVIYIFTVL